MQTNPILHTVLDYLVNSAIQRNVSLKESVNDGL